VIPEATEFLAKRLGDRVKNVERQIVVRTQLRQPVPVSGDEKESEDLPIVWLRKQALEDWDRALRYAGG
jgi:hypothetical protein